MKLQNIYYPLMVLACFELIAVLATFGDDRRNIVGKKDDQHKHNSKVKGRQRISYMSLHEKTLADPETKKDNLKQHRSPQKEEPKITTPKNAAENVLPTKIAEPPQAGKPAESDDNKKNGNQTKVGNHDVAALPGGGVMDQMDMKTVFFILLGISSLVIAYFVIRIARSKSRRKTKKYGVLATHGSEVELRPLEQDDEDEDMTVFDANSH